jgi:YfiR/HmsC-like
MPRRQSFALVGWLLGWLAGLLATGTGVAGEPAPVDRADQLRAGYLLNFVKFVEWPGGALDRWTLCFLGGDGIRTAILAAQMARQPGATGVTVRVLDKGEQTAGCQLLYVESAAAGDRAFDIASQPLLTVSDAADFTHRGGLIELFAEGNRLRFKINLDNARHAGLRISSSLLQLASQVDDTGR